MCLNGHIQTIYVPSATRQPRIPRRYISGLK